MNQKSLTGQVIEENCVKLAKTYKWEKANYQ